MRTKNGVLGFEVNLYPSDEIVAQFTDDPDWDRLHEYLSGKIKVALDEAISDHFGEWEVATP